MAVTFDAVGTLTTSNGVTTKDLTTLTVGSGTERALVVQLCWQFGLPTGITVIWDPTGTGTSTNQSCTAITGASAANGTTLCVALYGLIAPTSGNRTLRVSWTSPCDIYLQAVAWTGVDQTGGTTTFRNGTGATGTSALTSVTVTSATNNATMAVHAGANNFSAVSPTQTFLDNTASSISGAGNRAAGTSSNVMTGTIVSTTWAAAGTDILASAGVTNTIMFADQARS